MNVPIAAPVNPHTRGSVPILFFEDASGPAPTGTLAPPRPPDRPRLVPPDEARLNGEASSSPPEPPATQPPCASR